MVGAKVELDKADLPSCLTLTRLQVTDPSSPRGTRLRPEDSLLMDGVNLLLTVTIDEMSVEG
jgi:hypothetical protein